MKNTYYELMKRFLATHFCYCTSPLRDTLLNMVKEEFGDMKLTAEIVDGNEKVLKQCSAELFPKDANEEIKDMVRDFCDWINWDCANALPIK